MHTDKWPDMTTSYMTLLFSLILILSYFLGAVTLRSLWIASTERDALWIFKINTIRWHDLSNLLCTMWDLDCMYFFWSLSVFTTHLCQSSWTCIRHSPRLYNQCSVCVRGSTSIVRVHVCHGRPTLVRQLAPSIWCRHKSRLLTPSLLAKSPNSGSLPVFIISRKNKSLY